MTSHILNAVRTTGAVLVTGMLCVATACAADPSDKQPAESSCEAKEANGYAVLESSVEEALTGHEYELERRSACAETGNPWPSVVATVPGLVDREEAVQLLEGHGWSPEPGGGLVNPAGTIRAGVKQAGESSAVEIDFRGPAS